MGITHDVDDQCLVAVRLVLEAGTAKGAQLASVSLAGGEASVVPESPPLVTSLAARV